MGRGSCCMFPYALLWVSATVLHPIGSRQAAHPLAPAFMCPASLNASLTSGLIGRARMPGPQQNQWARWRTDRWMDSSGRMVSSPLLLLIFCSLSTARTHSHTSQPAPPKAHPLTGCCRVGLGLTFGFGHREAWLNEEQRHQRNGSKASDALQLGGTVSTDPLRLDFMTTYSSLTSTMSETWSFFDV